MPRNFTQVLVFGIQEYGVESPETLLAADEISQVVGDILTFFFNTEYIPVKTDRQLEVVILYPNG